MIRDILFPDATPLSPGPPVYAISNTDQLCVKIKWKWKFIGLYSTCKRMYQHMMTQPGPEHINITLSLVTIPHWLLYIIAEAKCI